MTAAAAQVSSSKPGTRGKWTLFNIGVLIVGFVVFWPVGLFLLVWILMDRDVRELPAIIRTQFNRLRGWMSRQSNSTSGNRVFDEFQQTQFDRIDEIKIEIRDRDNAFRGYKEEQDRAADQKQFDEFMQKKPTANAETAGG